MRAATVPVEEQVLRSRHGDAFDAYAAQVPRFWPAWRRLSSPAQIQVDLHALRLECARASRWGWIPVIGHMVSSCATSRGGRTCSARSGSGGR